MRAVKKINNNVAVCLDANGNELVAFGKGVGFPKMPYEITDLSKIAMTFYRVDAQTYQMLSEIPEEVLEVSAQAVLEAQRRLQGNLSPNIVFSLADHINFALERQKHYKDMKLPLDYDVKQLYPKEYEMGKYTCQLIKKELLVVLPDSEAVAIAMHFINGQQGQPEQREDDSFDDLSGRIVDFIEDYFSIKIDQDEFAFNRFLTHLRYYLKRIQSSEISDGEVNPNLLATFKKESPEVYACTQQIVNFVDGRYHTATSDDEMFYLMVYVNRIVRKSTCTEEGEE